MVDQIDDNVRAAAVEAIKAKARSLIAERQMMRDQMTQLDQRIRRTEIAIFDCRGAARLFDADISLPEDMATARAVWVRRIMDDGPAKPVASAPIPPELKTAPVPHAMPLPPGLFGFHTPTILGSIGNAEPSVREIAIEQLKRAGEAGSRASTVRQVAESILKKKLHEKTVGMTLYRLSKDGIARRQGQIWFFVPPKVEAKNPGGSAPGSVEARSNRKEGET